jgi:hypothetical protein
MSTTLFRIYGKKTRLVACLINKSQNVVEGKKAAGGTGAVGDK